MLLCFESFHSLESLQQLKVRVSGAWRGLGVKGSNGKAMLLRFESFHSLESLQQLKVCVWGL